MNSTRLSHPALEDHVFYLESSLPPGLTFNEYRRARPQRPARLGRLRRLARRA
jgi:hypothetical protein